MLKMHLLTSTLTIYYAYLVFETLNVYLRLPSEYSCVDFEHITFSLMRNILYILYKMDLVVFVRY